MLKTITRNLCPPLIWHGAAAVKRSLSEQPPPPPAYGFTGSYANYDDAMKECEGYDADCAVQYAILETRKICQDAPLDSRTMRLLAAFKMASHIGPLRVLDFGGSLGGHYLLLNRFLNIESWTVCELPKMAHAGRDYHGPHERLTFITNIYGCAPNVILASGALQACSSPYSEISRLLETGARYFIVDRVPLLSEERLTVHRVPPHIYPGSYPDWFFSESKFLEAFSGCTLRLRWRLEEHMAHLDGILQDVYGGFLFERI